MVRTTPRRFIGDHHRLGPRVAEGCDSSRGRDRAR
jgi:hypothetical protein